jgi:hypothetical protein
MTNLNKDILKILKFESISEFDKYIYNYFIEFEKVYENSDYLTRNKYVEKFTELYNLCNSISMIKNTEVIFDVYIYYKFIYERMSSFLSDYLVRISNEIETFDDLIHQYEMVFSQSGKINGVMEYLIKQLNSSSPISNQFKNYLELSKEVWNTEINLNMNVQNIIVDYIFNIVKKEIDTISSTLDEKLSKFLRLITLHEPYDIEMRYWFISKKITKMAQEYYTKIITESLKDKNLEERLCIINEYYSKNMEICDWYFVQFEEIPNNISSFIISHFIIEQKEYILDQLKTVLKDGTWNIFKNILKILNKIDDSGDLNEEIEDWNIEVLVQDWCSQNLEHEKTKFKESKYSNICRYLNFYKKIEYLFRQIKEPYIKILEDVIKTEINKNYGDGNQDGKFGKDFADFIYTFLNNYDKSKDKFDLGDDQNIDVVKLFLKLLENNDEFQIILQKFIAKRFLSDNRSQVDITFARKIASVEELDMLSSRIHVMIKDTQNFNELNTSFQTIFGRDVITNYTVVTDGIWGIAETNFMDEQAGYKINCVPSDIKILTGYFEEFHDMIYERRKLKWNYGFSELEIDFNIGDVAYPIKTIFPIAQILLYFNDNDKMMKIDVVREKISIKNMNILIDYGIIKSVKDYYIINDDYRGNPEVVLELTGVKNTIKRAKPEKKKTDYLEIDDMIKCYLMKIVKPQGTEALKRDDLIQTCIEKIKYRIEVDRARVNKLLIKLIEGEYLILDDNGCILYAP